MQMVEARIAGISEDCRTEIRCLLVLDHGLVRQGWYVDWDISVHYYILRRLIRTVVILSRGVFFDTFLTGVAVTHINVLLLTALVEESRYSVIYVRAQCRAEA